MNQISMQFSPLARRSDVQTSHIAASRAEAFRATHESKIFGAISDAGDRGLNYREIAKASGMEPVAVGRRLKRMAERRVIRRRMNGDKPEIRAGCCIWLVNLVRVREGA